ncbi:MAG: endonuclease/exonuclease/phosphatase family protein [Rickettsiales bacterium]|jgi:exodeoxyribonuclease-3|nr:endonuclease/exonuclease/phosphatase family protein [Rickettsiales bacterium]
MLKVATWNVNSIRARIVNFVDWTKEYSPDLIMLQELRCNAEQFPSAEFEDLGYNIEILGQKARNGVAIFSKFPLYDVNSTLPLYGLVQDDEDSRYLEASFDYHGKVIKVASIYVPNGGPSAIDVRNGVEDVSNTVNFSRKLKFFDRLKLKFEESVAANEMAFFSGDYNVCPNLSMDVYSVKKNGEITCTEEERKKFGELLEVGVGDIWRMLNPTLREYSWWGYRPYYMWERNMGFRLDAIITTPAATEIVKKCKIYSKETRGRKNASDHAPLMCLLTI